MRRSTRTLLWAGAVLGALVALILGLAAYYPVQHRASVAVVLSASPEQVWDRIRAFERIPEWRPGVVSVERLPAEPSASPTFRETNDYGTFDYRVVVDNGKDQLVTRIVDHPDFGGTWTYRLEARGGEKTRLEITEEGEIYDPLFRVLGNLVFSLDSTLRDYTTALKASFGG